MKTAQLAAPVRRILQAACAFGAAAALVLAGPLASVAHADTAETPGVQIEGTDLSADGDDVSVKTVQAAGSVSLYETVYVIPEQVGGSDTATVGRLTGTGLLAVLYDLDTDEEVARVEMDLAEVPVDSSGVGSLQVAFEDLDLTDRVGHTLSCVAQIWQTAKPGALLVSHNDNHDQTSEQVTVTEPGHEYGIESTELYAHLSPETISKYPLACEKNLIADLVTFTVDGERLADTVDFDGKIVATLRDLTTGEDVATRELELTQLSTSVVVTFPAIDLTGHVANQIGCCVQLWQGDRLIAEHNADYTEYSETVQVTRPSCGTELLSPEGTHEVAAGVVTLTDAVTVYGLPVTEAGYTYVARGTLYVRGTGEILAEAEAVLAVDEEGIGTAEVVFADVDLSDYAGRFILCRETVYNRDYEVAVTFHSGDKDMRQSVLVAEAEPEEGPEEGPVEEEDEEEPEEEEPIEEEVEEEGEEEPRPEESAPQMGGGVASVAASLAGAGLVGLGLKRRR